MKVTLRNSYNYESVVVTPEESRWDPDMCVELETEDVIEILALQAQTEAIQQRLRPLFEACKEAKQATYEREKLEKEEKELAALTKTEEFQELHSDEEPVAI